MFDSFGIGFVDAFVDVTDNTSLAMCDLFLIIVFSIRGVLTYWVHSGVSLCAILHTDGCISLILKLRTVDNVKYNLKLALNSDGLRERTVGKKDGKGVI